MDAQHTTESLQGGRSSWPEAFEGPLAEATCLWQDLDGLHVEPAPQHPPATSILWGWTFSGIAIRARLDGPTVHLAIYDATAREPHPQWVTDLPWAADDGRVKGARPADRGLDLPGLRLQHLVVDGIDTGSGPITFIRAERP